MSIRDTLTGTVRQWGAAHGAADDLGEQIADAHRAEVLREAVNKLDEKILAIAVGSGPPEQQPDGRVSGLCEAVGILRRMAEGAGQVGKVIPKDETTQPAGPTRDLPDAEIEFAIYGTLTLTGWNFLELAPDYYGHTYMQIGGWLPEGWDPERTPAGTQQMIRAHLHGRAVPRDLNVQVESKGYGEPCKFLKIQWRKGGADA